MFLGRSDQAELEKAVLSWRHFTCEMSGLLTLELLCLSGQLNICRETLRFCSEKIEHGMGPFTKEKKEPVLKQSSMGGNRVLTPVPRFHFRLTFVEAFLPPWSETFY